MDRSVRSNVSGGLFQNDAWRQNIMPLSLPAGPSEQYHFGSPSQEILDLASSTTATHTTPLSVSDSPLIYAPVPSSGPTAPFQDENTRTLEMATTDHWGSVVYPYSGTDAAMFSLAAKSGARNVFFRTNRAGGYERPKSPAQVAKVNNPPDLTSTGTRPRILENLDREGLGDSPLSRRKRLLIELRNRASGWRCPVCYQPFKRRDYMKPHVKRKHPECYVGLYCAPNSTPEPSVAAPANHRPTCESLLESGLPEDEQRRHPTFFWGSQLNNQITNPFQSHHDFPSGRITPQKMFIDLTTPDGGDFQDELGTELPSHLKASRDNWARPLACPFYKHSPLQHRKCLALSLRRPKDVKQHIYRSHTQPDFYCARCYHVFHDATERDAHWRDRLCDRLDGPMLLKFQGITEDQKKALNEKSPRDLSKECQWYQIYAIIFPASELPRSPYVGNWLEEIVPVLREKWETQGYNITARAVGDLGHDQLSCAMDLFFRSLEGEALGHEDDDSSICASSVQSHMGDDIQRGTLTL